MLYNPTRILFLATLFLGTLITVSSASWWGAWVGLEINLLSFIPLMMFNNIFSSEAALKYFLVQALASACLLFAILVWSSIDLLPVNSMLPMILLTTSLCLKVGAAPFHFWFPGVMEGLSWWCGMLLMTWQKIAPLILLSYLASITWLFSSIIIFSVVIGGLGGFNQTSLRKIMAYSSINHLGWMTAALTLGDNYWSIYFCFYTILSLILLFIFNQFQLNHLNQTFSMPSSNINLKLILFINLLSLGGLPPFMGFFPKWILIQTMVGSQLYFLITLMVVSTLITLFFYLRIAYTAFLLTPSETKWTLMVTQPIYPLLMTLTTLSCLGLLLTPLFLTFV